MGFRLRSCMFATLLLAFGAAGCHPAIWAYPFADRDAKDKVKAEHDLEADRLLILPYAAMDVEFESPAIGREVSFEIINEIMDNLRGRVHRVVDPRNVSRYQRRTLDWPNTPVAQIGREFKADKVLYIEIYRFSIMEERSANLYRGRIAGRIQIVDTSAPEGKEVLYESEVSVEVPDDKPIGAMEISESQLRWGTMNCFAQEVIQKFHDHEKRRMGGPVR
jgi:hypothetical protein